MQAYGEMVALLWAAGRVEAALELERLWNGLAERTPLSLLCGYPRALMTDDDDAAISRVCRLHSELVETAPLPEEADVARHFARSSRGPGLARRFVADTLRTWGLLQLVDNLALVVGELATNAVIHGGSAFTVAMSRAGTEVRVFVGDRSLSAPRKRAISEIRAEGGRGLVLVDAIATRWGHDKVAAGKLVWADLSD